MGAGGSVPVAREGSSGAGPRKSRSVIIIRIRHRSRNQLKLPAGSPGALITFEGLDGCGKTTQLELEAHHLLHEGWAVTATKEPGGTPVGQKIREIVLNP